MKRIIQGTLLALLFAWSCAPAKKKDAPVEQSLPEQERIGSIEIMDEAAKQLVSEDDQLEILSEGHDWTEGPLWIESEKMLLYSDIPPNSIFAWKEGEGSKLFLKPSGYTGKIEREGEPGSNGLLLDQEGNLVLCQHGDRQIGRLLGDLQNPKPGYETLVDNWQGKRLNSPNDAAYHENGKLYFTDPPYGLEKNVNDPTKEIPFQGVYRMNALNDAELLLDSITRPNGIAFSPDYQKLYVACSDRDKAKWYHYDLDKNGDITGGGQLLDVTDWVKKEKGLPDGLKVHPSGVLFATGPGGVWIIDATGKPLALIRTGQATSNCAFDEDFSHLYITADMYLLRLKLKV